MGYDIPIFFFSGDPLINGSNETSIEQIRNIIVDKHRNPIESGLYESNSHSWWHQNTIIELCTIMEIKGLEFLEEEIADLDVIQLTIANNALTQLLNQIMNGIPQTNKADEYMGIEILRKEDCNKALLEASPAYKIDYQAMNDFEEAVSLFSFIKSLQRAIDEALLQKQHLFYYRPGS